MNPLRGATRALAILCLLGAVGALAPAAQAAAPWSAPVELSAPGHTAFEQHVAIDPQGDAVAVWQRSNGTVSVVQAATRPAGSATWSAPVDISDLGSQAQLPRVAIDAAGEAVATWEASYAVNEVQVATLAPGGVWSVPFTLSEQGRNSSDPEIAMSPAGEAVVVWAGADSAGTSIAQEATRPAGGVWTVPVKLSAEGQNAELPAVAIDPSGAAVVAWARRVGVTEAIVQAKSRAPGGIWTLASNLSKPGGSAGEPSVAIDPAGDAVVSWQRRNGSYEVAQAVRRTGEAGAWSAPVDLSGAEESTYGTVAALDDAGDATVAWEALYGNTHVVAVAEAAAGTGAWSAPATISGTAAFEPALAVDPQGDAVAAWTERASGTETLQAARRAAGESGWSAPVDLTPADTENKSASVAVDPGGDAVIAWRHWDGANSIVEAATSDASQPAPGGEAETPPVTGPGTGTPPAGGGESQAPPAAGPPPAPTTPPAKARCPHGKSLRKVKVRVHGGHKVKTKTVLKCVKPGAVHHKKTKHRGGHRGTGGA